MGMLLSVAQNLILQWHPDKNEDPRATTVKSSADSNENFDNLAAAVLAGLPLLDGEEGRLPGHRTDVKAIGSACVLPVRTSAVHEPRRQMWLLSAVSWVVMGDRRDCLAWPRLKPAEANEC